MIRDLNISGFKALEQVQLTDLGRVNLIVGPNGSGKSSLLYAIFIFCLDANPEKLLDLFRNESPHLDAQTFAENIRWLFYRQPHLRTVDWDRSRELHLEITGSYESSDPTDGPSAVHDRAVSLYAEFRDSPLRPSGGSSHESSRQSSEDIDRVKDSATSIVRLTRRDNNNEVMGALYFSDGFGRYSEIPKGPPLIPASLTWPARSHMDLAKMWDKADIRGEAGNVIELLRHFDPEIVSIQIGVSTDGSPVLRIKHEHFGTTPLAIFGDGLASALRTSLQIAMAQFSVVLIDEFDSALHISVLRKLARFMCDCAQRTGTQLFLTTHRDDTVAAFANLGDTYSKAVVFHQTILRGSSTEIQSYSALDTHEMLNDQGIDIRWPT